MSVHPLPWKVVSSFEVAVVDAAGDTVIEFDSSEERTARAIVKAINRPPADDEMRAHGIASAAYSAYRRNQKQPIEGPPSADELIEWLGTVEGEC